MRAQTLSETEIVAIAAVAAAALGGVVIGLGRGQDNAVSRRPASLSSSAGERTRRMAERARGVLEDAETGIGRRVPEATESIRTGAKSLAAQVPASDGKRVGRSARSELSRAADRVDPSAIRSIVEDRVIHPVASMAKTRPERPAGRSMSTPKFAEIARQALDLAVERVQQVRGAGADGRRELKMPAMQTAAKRTRSGLGQLAHEVEERAPELSAPGLSGVEKRAAHVKSQVGDAARRAGGRSKAVAGETMATALWLGAASAVVYFLLLSPGRREQVKDAVCGGFEQLRLLVLDLQGYEPEM